MYGFSAVTRDNIIIIACKKSAGLPEFPLCADGGAACSAVIYTDAETGDVRVSGIRLTPEKLLKRFKRGHIFLRV